MTDETPVTESTSANELVLPTDGESASADITLPAKCAYINDKGVFQGMVDYPTPGTETSLHLLHVNQCDLGVGEYLWADGSFHPIKARNTANILAIDAIEASVKLLQKNDIDVPVEVLIWVKQLKTLNT